MSQPPVQVSRALGRGTVSGNPMEGEGSCS